MEQILLINKTQIDVNMLLYLKEHQEWSDDNLNIFLSSIKDVNDMYLYIDEDGFDGWDTYERPYRDVSYHVDLREVPLNPHMLTIEYIKKEHPEALV